MRPYHYALAPLRQYHYALAPVRPYQYHYALAHVRPYHYATAPRAAIPLFHNLLRGHALADKASQSWTESRWGMVDWGALLVPKF